GDRKRLLRAIASLCKIDPSSSSRESAPPAEANLPATPTPVPLAAGSDAERRPLTVMFCDLVDSTALASRLNAEDWRSLVNAYLDEASAAVTGLGGHVLKKLGDGLMALFGYPQAQENDDAERGVRAASRSSALLKPSTRGMRKGARRRSLRASGSIPDRSWSIRRAKCSARRPISPRASRVSPRR